MGSVWKQIENHHRLGGPDKRSSLSEYQKYVQQALSERMLGDLESSPFDTSELMDALFSSTTDEGMALSERMFSEALLGPALRSFDQEIRPRINSSFAGIGGTLSSRRSNAISDALGDTMSAATSGLAGILPQTMAFPLQQTLAQIQGFGALEGIYSAPVQRALPFALQGTSVFPQVPMGPGMEVLREYGMSTAGTAGGLQFGGPLGMFKSGGMFAQGGG